MSAERRNDSNKLIAHGTSGRRSNPPSGTDLTGKCERPISPWHLCKGKFGVHSQKENESIIIIQF
jgi:hypothetical protein